MIDPSVESIESTQQIRFTTTDTIYIKMIVFRTLFVGGETENRDCQWWNWTSYCSWSLPVCDQWWWLASCPPQHCWQASCPPPWWCLCLCLTLQHHQNRLIKTIENNAKVLTFKQNKSCIRILWLNWIWIEYAHLIAFTTQRCQGSPTNWKKNRKIVSRDSEHNLASF